MKSIWNTVEKPSFPQLQDDIKTDILVIGGGMCGILCAYMLKNAGIDCVLVEADRICAGVTNGTTAKITVQHGLLYDKITKKYGEQTARFYYESQKKAFDLLVKMAEETDADLEFCDSFVYSLQDRRAPEREAEILNKIGCKAKVCTDTELPFSVAGAVKVERQATFQPLKFAYAVARDLKIYENTKIIALKPDKAITNHGSISANKTIVATHFPFINKHGGYFLKMYQHRSYVLALENVSAPQNMYVDAAKDGLSFRKHGDILLLGGGGHRTGNKSGNWEVLRRFVQKYYPDAKEVGCWATQDCMSLDSIPYIGKYSPKPLDLYVATGFNKWGMTSSMVAAMLLADIMRGIPNKYESVYLPQRTVLHPQLWVNIFESTKGLLTPTTPRCPHLGCALKYNKQEHSWDCPCHGSRFEETGKLINNPATDDKTF